MLSLPRLATTLAVLSAALVGSDARQISKDALRARQAEAAKSFHLNARAASAVKSSGVKNITFSNPAASRT